MREEARIILPDRERPEIFRMTPGTEHDAGAEAGDGDGPCAGTDVPLDRLRTVHGGDGDGVADLSAGRDGEAEVVAGGVDVDGVVTLGQVVGGA